MESIPEQNPKQASQAESTREEIEKKDVDGLLEWIK